MVNIFNSWAQIVEFVQHFSIFLFGYAYAKLGLLKTAGLLGVFIIGNWLWHHSALVGKVVTTLTGGEG